MIHEGNKMNVSVVELNNSENLRYSFMRAVIKTRKLAILNPSHCRMALSFLHCTKTFAQIFVAIIIHS